MPTVSQWMIKAGMAHLALALLLRVIAACWEGGGAALGAVWWHGLVVGWLTQLIFAVAWWMFPTLSREKRRGSEGLMWASAVGLNVGLVARLVGEPALAWTGGAWWASVLLWASALVQVVSVASWIGLIWPRVRPPRVAGRGEARGGGGM